MTQNNYDAIIIGGGHNELWPMDILANRMWALKPLHFLEFNNQANKYQKMQRIHLNQSQTLLKSQVLQVLSLPNMASFSFLKISYPTIQRAHLAKKMLVIPAFEKLLSRLMNFTYKNPYFYG